MLYKHWKNPFLIPSLSMSLKTCPKTVESLMGWLLTHIHGCLSASCAVIRLAGFTVSILLIRFLASGVTVSHSGEGYCQQQNRTCNMSLMPKIEICHLYLLKNEIMNLVDTNPLHYCKRGHSTTVTVDTFFALSWFLIVSQEHSNNINRKQY